MAAVATTGQEAPMTYFFIDRAVVWEVKSRKKNFAMAWINYDKAYNIVSHSWIPKALGMFGVAENI